MFRRMIISFFFVVAIALSLVFAQSSGENVKPVKKTILILRNATVLEKSVARILNDTLSKSGYTVKIAKLTEANKEDPSLYTVSIVFSAIMKNKEIDSRIAKFIESSAGTSKVVLFAVNGSAYEYTEDYKVDAETSASAALRAPMIANRILQKLGL